MADLQQKINALKGLVSVLNSIDDGETQSAPPASPPPQSCPRSVPGRNHRMSGECYSHQSIKGLSNQTGRIEGNANGAINFGIASGICNIALGTSDARDRQSRRPAQAESRPNRNTTSAATITAPSPCEEHERNNCCKTSSQSLKGLTNQTGFVKGNANGVINFGTLTSNP
ncbi:hypothetical protein PIB30_000254 [Stylosanthes scabra]|uniref:Uncharacterized protein n=1 Tax=Stylosanthes scabra TaxID=79078 RepID=A0ABU6S287_9FABA|nr:hypothetical protein [Stylosanthes scabra]